MPRPRARTLFHSDHMRVGRMDYPDGLVQRRHGHERASVTLVLTGSVEERVGSRERRGCGLQVVARRAGVEHACRWLGPANRTLSIEFDPARTTGLDVARIPRWSWLERPEPARALVELWRSSRERRLEDEVEDRLLELLAALEPHPPADPGRAPSWLRKCRDRLVEEAPRRVPTATLALEADVHPVHVARAFRAHYGSSPTEFARVLRLRLATGTLVQDRSLPIGRLAHRTGFADHSHLCRDLSAWTGITPSLWRRLAGRICDV